MAADERTLFYSAEGFMHHLPPDESSLHRYYISMNTSLTCEPLRAKEASVTIPVARKV